MGRVFKMPDPPGEEVQAVRDAEGIEWKRADRAGDMWRDAEGKVSWDNLIYDMGPVEAVE